MQPVFSMRIHEDLSGSRRLALLVGLLMLPLMVIATDQLIVGPESDLLVDEIYSDSLGWREVVSEQESWRNSSGPSAREFGRISVGYDASYEATQANDYNPFQRETESWNDTKPATLFRINF